MTLKERFQRTFRELPNSKPEVVVEVLLVDVRGWLQSHEKEQDAKGQLDQARVLSSLQEIVE